MKPSEFFAVNNRCRARRRPRFRPPGPVHARHDTARQPFRHGSVFAPERARPPPPIRPPAIKVDRGWNRTPRALGQRSRNPSSVQIAGPVRFRDAKEHRDVRRVSPPAAFKHSRIAAATGHDEAVRPREGASRRDRAADEPVARRHGTRSGEPTDGGAHGRAGPGAVNPTPVIIPDGEDGDRGHSSARQGRDVPHPERGRTASQLPGPVPAPRHSPGR